jgi:hypothetical protein
LAQGDGDIVIEIDELTLGQVQRDLDAIPNGVNKAIAGAVKKAAAQGRTIVVESLYKLLNVKSRTPLRQRVTVPRATGGGEKGEAVLRLAKTRMGLGNFAGVIDTRDKKQGFGHGVNVQLFRGGGELLNVPRGFTAKYRGGASVLMRKKASVTSKTPSGRIVKTYRGGGGLVARYPIIPLVGQSPSHVAQKHDEILVDAKKQIQLVLREQLLSQVDRLLKRKKIDRPSDEGPAAGN